MAHGAVVIVTRPEPGASRTMAALAQRGLDALCLPLTLIKPCDGVAAPSGDFDGVVFTSQNAVRHGAHVAAKASYRAFCVGERTAGAARARGFHVDAAAENARSLLPLIIAAAPRRLLYVTGAPRRPDIEHGLARAAIGLDVLEVYRAIPVEGAAERIAAAAGGESGCHNRAILLLHAPSAADLLAPVASDLAAAHPVLLCLSDAVAAALDPGLSALAGVADRPDEAALLALLDDEMRRLQVAGASEGA
ncbi:MAG: uroporphyrinogen-III synthase [Rhizobiaceae bacterium]|jgi:uroporphyrinogen-III synthase|nr:uroporphyrinogen-III synthase [Rhizobiaceae bacterium]